MFLNKLPLSLDHSTVVHPKKLINMTLHMLVLNVTSFVSIIIPTNFFKHLPILDNSVKCVLHDVRVFQSSRK